MINSTEAWLTWDYNFVQNFTLLFFSRNEVRSKCQDNKEHVANLITSLAFLRPFVGYNTMWPKLLSVPCKGFSLSLNDLSNFISQLLVANSFSCSPGFWNTQFWECSILNNFNHYLLSPLSLSQNVVVSKTAWIGCWLKLCRQEAHTSTSHVYLFLWKGTAAPQDERGPMSSYHHQINGHLISSRNRAHLGAQGGFLLLADWTVGSDQK